jgi:hypothetical protein
VDAIVGVERVVLRPNPLELALVILVIALVVGLVRDALARSRGRSVVAPRNAIRAVARTLAGLVLVFGAVVAFDIATLFAGWLLWPVLAVVSLLGLVLLARGARDVWLFGTGPGALPRIAAAVGTVAMLAVYGLAVLVRPAWVAAPSACEQQTFDRNYEPPPPWEPITLPAASTPEAAAAALNVPTPLTFGGGEHHTFAMRPSDSGGVDLLVESGTPSPPRGQPPSGT